MGVERYQRKIARASINLASLTDDLSRVKTPNIRQIILAQIAQAKTQINRLMFSMNCLTQAQAMVTQPLPEKKTSPPKATIIVKKKKGVDEQN